MPESATISNSVSKLNHASSRDEKLNKALSGIGLGGGSIPHKGFSYISSGSPVHQSNIKDKTKPTSQIGVKSPNRITTSLESFKKSSSKHRNKSAADMNQTRKQTSSKSTSPKRFETVNSITQSSLHQSKPSIPRPDAKLSTKTANVSSRIETPVSSSLSKTQSKNWAKNKVASKSVQNSADTDGESRQFISRLNRSFKSSKTHRPKPVAIPTIPTNALNSQSDPPTSDPKPIKDSKNKSGSPVKTPITPSTNNEINSASDHSATQDFGSYSSITPANFSSKENNVLSNLSTNQTRSTPLEKVWPQKQTKNDISVMKSKRKLANNYESSDSSTKEKKLLTNQSNESRSKTSLFGFSKSISKKPRTKIGDKNKVNSTSVVSSNLSEIKLSTSNAKGKGSPKSLVSKLTKYAKPSKFSPVSKQKHPTSELNEVNNSSQDSNFLVFSEKLSPKLDKNVVSPTSDPLISQTTGFNGSLKPSSLKKSESGSSVLTDSSASNVSSAPSLRTKKVSFQNDITVCGTNGISTYSNGLRSPDITHGSDPPVLYDNSISQEVEENFIPLLDQTKNFVYHPPELIKLRHNWKEEWHDPSSHSHPASMEKPTYFHQSQTSNEYATGKCKYLDSYDCLPGYEEPCQNASPIVSPISNVTPGVLFSNLANENHTPTTTCESHEHFVLSCESPIPVLICQSNPETDNNQLILPSVPETDLNQNSQTFTLEDLVLDNNKDRLGYNYDSVNGAKETLIKLFESDKTSSAAEGPPYYERCETPSGIAASTQPDDDVDYVEQVGHLKYFFIVKCYYPQGGAREQTIAKTRSTLFLESWQIVRSIKNANKITVR